MLLVAVAKKIWSVAAVDERVVVILGLMVWCHFEGGRKRTSRGWTKEDLGGCDSG